DYRKQFIYASSAATYGDGSRGFEDRGDLDFVNGLRPLNPYGWSKVLFDRKVAREVFEKRETPLQYAGLKFFNVYGPN
ncbi:MAG: NAD-dependent epimerase/dehydratase family protein, partial [Pseudomonadota bacterium]|nr:NAD-dependent epimerase/dehydratase family protein [Pseudomonadota bacterium]